ncbi:MAG TPA: ECF-type sigma factor [Vicinamibacterales bacterium]|nr:ECF-type sigma factor [Vicinamibacterales bacterium]
MSPWDPCYPPDGGDGDGQITRLLEAVRGGDPRAIDHVFDLVYDELRAAARRQLARARPNQTLNTTVLVHEVYLKLADRARAQPTDRGHFFAVAARAMRQIIIDYARTAARQKRGGELQRIPLEAEELSTDRAGELVALDDALSRLESFSDRLARIVELRFFAGLSVEETAEALAVPAHQVKRDWRKARAFLFDAMQR